MVKNTVPALVGLLALGVALQAPAEPEKPPTAPAFSSSEWSEPQSPEVAEMERKLYQRINQVRKEQGLEPLVASEALTRVARAHSSDMARRGYFNHTSPSGATYFDRLGAAGIRYSAAGENIFMSRGLPQANLLERVVEGWMRSSGHRSNILNRTFTDSGIGVWREGKATFFVHDFLRPR